MQYQVFLVFVFLILPNISLINSSSYPFSNDGEGLQVTPSLSLDIEIPEPFVGAPGYEGLAVVLCSPYASRYADGKGVRTDYKLAELDRTLEATRAKECPVLVTRDPSDQGCLIDDDASDVTPVEFSCSHATSDDEEALVDAVKGQNLEGLIVMGNLHTTILRQLQRLQGDGCKVFFVSNLVFREDGRMLNIRACFGPDFTGFGTSTCFH